MIGSASIVLLLHAAYPTTVIGSGVLRVRLLDGSKLSPVNVPNTEDTTAQPADISADELQPAADASRSSPQGVNGYLPVSALSERPELVIDIDPDWYLHGLDLPSLTALLLINEYGDVDDLVFDISSPTPMLSQDLRMRFRAARFLPGRVDGKPVKAALRVVIQLE